MKSDRTRPLIAIVGRELASAEGIRGAGFGAGRLYLDAVYRAGGLPIIVPPLDISADHGSAAVDAFVADLLAHCDGVVLHGGGDIDPAHYGRQPITDTLYGLNERHDLMEIALVRRILDVDRPLLAICRGLQVLNVVCGGTLVQDLDQTAHPGHRRALHPVTLTPGSRVALAMGTDRPTACHSFHHQAVEVLGEDLVITGHSDDGVVEAVESTTSRWVVGVQWHPEDTAVEDPHQQGLFENLVVRCR